jgi:glycosyltransferase involved in cell wall biosynthesis
MDSFLSELPGFLHQFPDHQELGHVDALREKSSVLPLGFEFAKLDAAAAATPATAAEGSDERPPLILWNHRWEYDKNPDEFFEALKIVGAAGIEFEVALLGESFDVIPDCFASAERQFGDRIVQFGYVESYEEYTRWLHRSDILPVTSNQDFFGAAVVEAVYCDCFPLLPDRLAFPELFPAELRPSCFYKDFGDLVRRLGTAIQQIDRLRKISFKNITEAYDWRRMAPVYDATFRDTAAPK